MVCQVAGSILGSLLLVSPLDTYPKAKVLALIKLALASETLRKQ